jgi:hypothetical protein
MRLKALSIVAPSGTKIANGQKTIEVRSWKPTLSPNEDLLIVENTKFLRQEGDTDPMGKAVAIVKVKAVREYLKSDIRAACASSWDTGYYSWLLTDIRPVESEATILAARNIYDVDFDF